MKNTTLLKVLSATAIFSAIAAIEAYDQDNFAFAAETPVVASNSATATTPAATTPAATTPATTTPKADEPATVPQDVKALKDGEYKITAEAINFGNGKSPSMAAAGLDNEKTKLIVKNGQYSVSVTFKPIALGTMSGYLGDLKYYDGDKTHANRDEIKDNEFKDSTIVENYSDKETDKFIDAYKEKFPNRTVYPKTVNYNVDKNKIDSNNKLETFTEVFVPVMASINPASGTQRMILKFDLSSLARKKVTADNYEAATYENPNKDVEYKGTIKKDFPIHVQGHLRNANNNDEESLYGSALDSYVKVEKVGDKYKYTLRFKKGLADVGGEFYPFELHKVAYQGKDIPLTTLASNGNSSVKEGSITTDKLLEKIQLDGTAPYPNGALMSHFVTLKLYYETATDYKERPVKLEDVVVPAKPKPVKPTPTKPKEEPKPATPTAADHAVEADKVPNTFPTTVKAELNGRTTDAASIYENAFVKDVKVEKIGDKYQYTIQVKEGKSSTYLLRNKPFTVSKLTYKGNEINFTEVDAATKLKEGKILTDSLLDKIQVDTVISVQTKGGAKPRFEERAAESTIALDFPTVEKVKEEAINNLVPAKINNAHVADKPSMANDALVPERTRVEKVNGAYHYYLTFKDLRFGAQVGTIDTLSVDNTAAERTDLGGEGHEKVFHFTSPDKLTEKTITFSVLVDGKPLRGHSNVAATLKFNWDAATPLTADHVTSLHNDETTKAQAEKERLEREKAEADRLEKERLEKEAAAKAEKERLEKEAAAKAQAEKEKLEKEKAEADRLEKERLEKEAAAKAKAEKERLEKEAAAKAQAEKEKLEKEKAKLEELKKEALANIANNKDVNKEEASKLKEIVNSASLKDTLVAKVIENGSSEEIKVSFDNSAVKASNFVVEKANKETVEKVEELVKKADENLSVVKTIDLHFTDANGNTVNKQGETRAVTVAVVANEDEKLEVYYVNGNKLEKVPSVYKDGKLTFFTNHFSLYTIVKEDIKKTKFETGEALVQPELPALNELPKSETGEALVQPELPELNEISKAEKGEALVQPELPALSEIPKSETGEALVQPELPELNINDLNKEQKAKEQAQPSTQDIFGQNENKEDKKAEVEKTSVQKTSQTVTKGLKALANTGVSSTATVGLGALVLLSALVLRRKNNK